MNTLESLPFVNSFARLPDSFYSRLDPTPLERPRLVSFNAAAAALIDLHPSEATRPEFVAYFNGERRLPGSDPLAALYAGHQFGQYVPQLGDGRAILLGEVLNGRGERWEVQLKGAGVTPFSRRGDGRAVLRSVIREYLGSEAMHGLGIPTTRALCILGSEEEVYREQIEKGALLVRLAPSHVRFGSFEVFYWRQEFEALQRLGAYVLEVHYPHLHAAPDPYLALFGEVIERTARLLAQWQAVGFAHGVMNTDNMSILGLTLDYGPFGFLDDYEPGFICNHSDYQGRYAFDRQPDVALWNLSRLGQAMLPLFEGEPEAAAERANALLQGYEALFHEAYLAQMRRKLGLREAHAGDAALVTELLDLMATERADYTNTFRALVNFSTRDARSALRDHFLHREAFDQWAAAYRARLQAEGSDDNLRRAAMARCNPCYVLRNYLAQNAIARAEQGDYEEVERLLDLLRDPYVERADRSRYAEPPPDWGRHLEISCSS